MPQYDVFVSHSSKDKVAIVREFCQSLSRLGLHVWLDEDIILTGDNILDEIKKGVSDSSCILLIITPQFFTSNWTPLEIGLSMAEGGPHIIPLIVDIPIAEIAEKFPFILAQKYLRLEKEKIDECAACVNKTVVSHRERIKYENPFDYHEKVRQLNNLDSPGTNKLSILISEYEQLCKISVISGVSHATHISAAIIEDVYLRIKLQDDPPVTKHSDLLEILAVRNSGLNRNVYEHLKALLVSAQNILSSITNDADKKKMTDLSLASVLDWYMQYISITLRKNKNDERIDIAWSDELTYADFIEMHAIDKMVLRPDLIAPPEITYGWYKYNSYSHIAVRSSMTKKIVGYFTLFPVTEELFEKIKSGDFKDNDLDTSGIRLYDMPDFYKLYVACVCIHPDYQNTTAFNRLYSSLIRMMYDLAVEREVYITEIITEASTPQGLKLCKILGFKKIKNTNLATELYGASLLPPSLRLNSNFGSKLIRFYKDKYLELGELF